MGNTASDIAAAAARTAGTACMADTSAQFDNIQLFAY